MVLRTEDKAEQENWIKYLNNPKAEIKKQENKAEVVEIAYSKIVTSS